MRINTIILLLATSLLTACTSIWPYKSDFPCEVPEGEHCMSLYEVNKRADLGKYKPDDKEYSLEEILELDAKKAKNRKSRCKIKMED